MIKGKYYSAKCKDDDYSPELQNCIEKACDYCLNAVSNEYDEKNKPLKPIMMLGKIQSGKTRAFTGLMALAFDNTFDKVIILTKNSTALVQQTYKRMRREFKDFIAGQEVEVFDIMKIIDQLTGYELDKKLILVVKKETRNLDRITKFISDYTLQGKNCLIIDDEADTTGIGFIKVKDSEDEFDLRTVASKVNKIRGSLNGCAFVQVTATPYALYLQPNFNESAIEPVKPQTTVLVPSGVGYIGGEDYFLNSKIEGSPARYIYEEVPSDEHHIVTMRKGDRRIFKEEDILTREDKLQVFKRGLMNFIVGGCVIRMENAKAHMSYVIHTNTQKDAHKRLADITNEFIAQLKNRTDKTDPLIEKLLIAAYADIKNSIEAYGKVMPDYEEVKKAFFYAIDKGYVSITTVNSDKEIDTVLDEENGELRLRTPFSVFVGGQVLDRGVTIPKMIGFYYGRSPQTMQQDTVMQHSRMFGYRDISLLSVTRFYTTRRIYESMTKITEIDLALREDIEAGKFEEGIYFLREDERGQIVPCSPDKIRMSNIVMIKPGRRILPIGFSPVAKTYAAKNVREINKVLLKILDKKEQGAVRISINKIEELIRMTYEGIKPDEDAGRFVSLEQFLTTLRYLAIDSKFAYLVVRRGRKLSKFKNNGTVYQDAPDTQRDELRIAREAGEINPVLMMIQQDGSGDGWNGSEFWWPILLTQKKMKSTVFALEVPDGVLKK